MHTKGSKRDKSKYCQFHKDHGHDTSECRHLKEEIELLIKREYLQKYVQGDERKRKEARARDAPNRSSLRRASALMNQERSPTPESFPREEPHQPLAGIIATIAGAAASGGTSSSTRKPYARQKSTVHASSKRPKVDHVISFSDKDLHQVILPHDNALVITMLVANWEVKKILVDNGSSGNILYYHAFKGMLLGEE
ncbi:uncharacterized protein LOC143883152 [Tasmannia lanceolata]|uniref:uncharacterized protein LOC143883152 n=1 Tax=Tasmannia lanceolata TaxID=3420 RepID=UPI004064A334